jgi:hypothetical protein
MPIKGKLEIIIKIQDFPSAVKILKDSRQHFQIEIEDGVLVDVVLKPKSLKSLEEAKTQWSSWTAAIKGTFGGVTPRGFALKNGAVQVYANKAVSKTDTPAATQNETA